MACITGWLCRAVLGLLLAIFHSTCHCMINVSKMYGVHTLRPKQNGCHFADGFSNAFSWNQRVLIPIIFSLDFIRVFNYVYANTSSYTVLTRNKQQAIHNLFSSGDLFWWSIYAGHTCTFLFIIILVWLVIVQKRSLIITWPIWLALVG